MLITLNEDNSYKKVRWISFRKFALDNSLELLEVNNMKDVEEYIKLNDIKYDIFFEVGWSYLIPKTIFSIASLGAYGFHPSLLPQGKGTGLIGGVINGYDKWGASLFKLEEDFDNGEVVGHAHFTININDDIKTLYDKAEDSYISLFHNLIQPILDKKIVQIENKMIESRYPRRVPDDGEINWSRSNTSLKLYNFIRAQSHPYPGAFTHLNNKKL